MNSPVFPSLDDIYCTSSSASESGSSPSNESAESSPSMEQSKRLRRCRPLEQESDFSKRKGGWVEAERQRETYRHSAGYDKVPKHATIACRQQANYVGSHIVKNQINIINKKKLVSSIHLENHFINIQWEVRIKHQQEFLKLLSLLSISLWVFCGQKLVRKPSL